MSKKMFAALGGVLVVLKQARGKKEELGFKSGELVFVLVMDLDGVEEEGE